VVVILEPDGKVYWECLTKAQWQERVDLIKYAVSILKAKPNTHVYVARRATAGGIRPQR